jgi:mannosyltransferase OCH1-like enzyme
MAERFDEALEECLNAIKLRPNLHLFYLKAAQVAARLGRNEEVSAFLSDAERFSGGHPEITAVRIELLRFTRNLREAEALFANLPPEKARHFPIIVQAVECAIALGQLDVARDRVVRLQPQTAVSNSIVSRLKAKILETAWDHEGALDKYEAALPAIPNDAGIHHELAKCNLLLFKPSVALKHHKKSHELNASANFLRGSSHNFSQSHMGHLINEFLLDTELLSELQSLQPLDGTAKLTRLRNLVRENPDHLASALALILELRKCSRLTPPRDRGGALIIPRSIVQFWDDSVVPDEISELAASWHRLNPDFSYCMFSEESAAAFLRKSHPPETYSAFRRSHEPTQKADLFRLAYLASCGGFYADCDDRCATPLENFIPARSTFTAYQEEYGTLGNNFIGATANHPVICRALDLAVEAINRGDRDIVWLSTGPGLLTRAYASVVAQDPDEFLSKSAIFTVGEIQRSLELHCPVKYKSTGRHWLRSAFAVRRKASSDFIP